MYEFNLENFPPLEVHSEFVAVILGLPRMAVTKEGKGWVTESVLLPKKRKLPKKFLLVEINEDELQDIFQLLGLESVQEEEFEEDNCEAIHELQEKLLNSFRLTDTQEQKKVPGGQDSKRRKV